ncbi:MAG: helix-turn-helix domain-containing protein [Bacteroidetes bacterium]|nr:helix-turn-helix domain-containing protein [Bacteroidota bacterium]MCL2301779.1 helix-turn-helix domain-containing protein [Lentimicrobiaceae bacterium]
MYEKYLSMHSVPAGAILEHILKNKHLSQKEIAESSAIYPQRINDLIKGKRKFTPELSNRLEKALGISTLGYFYKIQTNHDIYNYQDEQERKITPDLSKLHKTLFWDTDIEKMNWVRSANYVIQRAFEYGNKMEIEEIIRFYGLKEVTKALNAIPKTDTWKLNERNKNREKFKI